MTGHADSVDDLTKTAVGPIPALVLALDHEFVVVDLSERCRSFLGYSAAELTGCPLTSILTMYSNGRFHADIKPRVLAGEAVFDVPLQLMNSAGDVLDVVASFDVEMRSGIGISAIWLALSELTDRSVLENEIARLDQRYRSIVENQKQLICRYDPDFTLTFVNKAYRDYFGRDNLIGTCMLDLLPPEVHSMVKGKVARLKPMQPSVSVDEIKLPDGRIEWREWTDLAFADDHGQVIEYQAVGLDITERRLMENRIRAMALEDPLTGLANRTAFDSALELAISAFKRYGQPFALLFIDLDYFKAVNDTYGHKAGDDLLIVIAERLRSCLGANDLAARLGGDEFAVLKKLAPGSKELAPFIRSLMARVGEKAAIAAEPVFPSLSIGAACCPEDAQQDGELRGKADAAVYAAKSAGRGTWRRHQSGMSGGQSEEASLISEVKASLHAGHFELEYQPILDMHDRQLAGVQPMLRWRHPKRGRLLADKFIGPLEDSPVILDVTEWVTRQACFDFAKLQNFLPAGSRLWLKTARRCMVWRGLVDCLENSLDNTGLRCGQIILNVRAFSPAVHPETMDIVTTLEMMGLSLALSGFGTEPVALADLRLMPVEILKMDYSQLEAMEPAFASALIQSTGKLCQSLGLAAAIGFLETSGQCETARAAGFRFGQGYAFAGAMPVKGLIEWLSQRSSPFGPHPVPNSDRS